VYLITPIYYFRGQATCGEENASVAQQMAARALGTSLRTAGMAAESPEPNQSEADGPEYYVPELPVPSSIVAAGEFDQYGSESGPFCNMCGGTSTCHTQEEHEVGECDDHIECDDGENSLTPQALSDLLAAITDEDSEVIATLIERFPTRVALNEEREAIQVMNCKGDVVRHMDIPKQLAATLARKLGS
jgi:hypothetical protein